MNRARIIVAIGERAAKVATSPTRPLLVPNEKAIVARAKMTPLKVMVFHSFSPFRHSSCFSVSAAAMLTTIDPTTAIPSKPQKNDLGPANTRDIGATGRLAQSGAKGCTWRRFRDEIKGREGDAEPYAGYGGLNNRKEGACFAPLLALAFALAG